MDTNDELAAAIRDLITQYGEAQKTWALRMHAEGTSGGEICFCIHVALRALYHNFGMHTQGMSLEAILEAERYAETIELIRAPLSSVAKGGDA